MIGQNNNSFFTVYLKQGGPDFGLNIKDNGDHLNSQFEFYSGGITDGLAACIFASSHTS